MFQNFPNFQNFQIFKFLNFKISKSILKSAVLPASLMPLFTNALLDVYQIDQRLYSNQDCNKGIKITLHIENHLLAVVRNKFWAVETLGRSYFWQTLGRSSFRQK